LHVVRPPDDTPCVVGGQVARAVLTADTGVPRLDGGLCARAARRRAPRPVPTRGPTAGRHASTTPSGTCTHSAPGSACGKPHANSVVGITGLPWVWGCPWRSPWELGRYGDRNSVPTAALAYNTLMFDRIIINCKWRTQNFLSSTTRIVPSVL